MGMTSNHIPITKLHVSHFFCLGAPNPTPILRDPYHYLKALQALPLQALHLAYEAGPFATYDVPTWPSGRPSRVVVSSAAGLIITVTNGEGEVIEREAGCAKGPQALSRMLVVDHSVRLRRPQASMVLI